MFHARGISSLIRKRQENLHGTALDLRSPAENDRTGHVHRMHRPVSPEVRVRACKAASSNEEAKREEFSHSAARSARQLRLLDRQQAAVR